MFARLSATLLLVLACAAHPLVDPARSMPSSISLPLVKRVNLTGMTNLLAHDKARARQLLKGVGFPMALFSEDASEPDSVGLTNTLVSYTVQIGIGSPAHHYDLIVDTGSSNTWVGANLENPYHPSHSSRPTGKLMSVTYGSGSFTGDEVIDQVTIGDLVIKKQAIGAALESQGFQNVDGILGIGPTALTEGTTRSIGLNEAGEEVPTVVDNAAQQGLISSKVVGIYFEPPTQENEVNGRLTFGYADASAFTGDLYTVAITSTSPASNYVGIDQSITYGEGGSTILATTAGIVDTGTTLILLATSAYNKYKETTGATLDTNTGLLCLSLDQYSELESLFFHIGSETFEFTANAQIWPRAFNAQIGGTDDKVYLIIADAGSDAGSGLDFINGQTFLERFYTTYDSTNNLFGIATTEFTYYGGN